MGLIYFKEENKMDNNNMIIPGIVGTSTSRYDRKLKLYTEKDLTCQETSKLKHIDNVEELYEKFDNIMNRSYSIMSTPRNSWKTRRLFNYLLGIYPISEWNWTGLTDRYGRMVCYKRKRIYMDCEERFNKSICFDHNEICIPIPQISTDINLSEVIHSFYLEYMESWDYYDDDTICVPDYCGYFPISFFYPRINLYNIEWYCYFMKYHDDEANLSRDLVGDIYALPLDQIGLSFIDQMTCDFINHHYKSICNKIIPYRADENKNKPDKNVHKSFKKRK
jgi:hypothetical protein